MAMSVTHAHEHSQPASSSARACHGIGLSQPSSMAYSTWLSPCPCPAAPPLSAAPGFSYAIAFTFCRFQWMAAARTAFERLSAVSSSTTSASGSSCSISSLCSRTSRSMARPALSSGTSDTSEAKASTSFCWSASIGGLGSESAPITTGGQRKKITGIVPSMHCSTSQRRMPASTEVGQSGPPTSTDTLGKVRPRCIISRRIARVLTVFTPTILRTDARDARKRPTPSCCTRMAIPLRPKAVMVAMQMPAQYPYVCRAAEVTTMPPVMKMLVAGTAGMRKSTAPAPTYAPITAPRGSPWSEAVSHERSSTISFPAPTVSV
mmetsp:Transcript_26171/g.67640  ORF Transcript_26171/g.67640 Transcript_26171/m.67640 type:complete len:320 (+) Transcript_26171:439-1398(+)